MNKDAFPITDFMKRAFNVAPPKEAERLYVACLNLCESMNWPQKYLRIFAPVLNTFPVLFEEGQWIGGVVARMNRDGEMQRIEAPPSPAHALDPVAWLEFPSLDDAQEAMGLKRLQVPIAYMKGVEHYWTELRRVATQGLDFSRKAEKQFWPAPATSIPFVGCKVCFLEQDKQMYGPPITSSPICYYELTAIPLPKKAEVLPLP